MDVGPLSLDALASTAAPLLAVPVLGGEDGEPALPAGAEAFAGDFAAVREDARSRAGSVTLARRPEGDGPRRIAFIGAGAAAELDGEAVRRFAGAAVRRAEALELDGLAVLAPAGDLGDEAAARAAAEGLVLAAWRFRELKTGAGESSAPTTVTSARLAVTGGDDDALAEGIRVGRAVARGQCFARDLQHRPGNVATPTHLGEEAERIAGELGLGVEVFDRARIEKESMNALLAVSAGSDEEPRFIVLRHEGGDGGPPLVLVGKGLTFDAGGISIKPAKGMEDMKYDMSGGAAVLGAMHAVAELDLPLDVVGVVPSSENLISGKALKPGDVIRTRSGKTVEVVNTDAEGRLILCDALDWVTRELAPAAVVDLATLTGAVVVGLGHHAAGLLGTDAELVEELRKAGDAAGERCWPLPLWSEYRKQLDSEAADLMNVGGRPAGTITAACFLREFVGDASWAHLDIAGTAYSDSPLSYQRKGGSGFPVRLLVEWLRGRAG